MFYTVTLKFVQDARTLLSLVDKINANQFFPEGLGVHLRPHKYIKRINGGQPRVRWAHVPGVKRPVRSNATARDLRGSSNTRARSCSPDDEPLLR